MKSQLGVCCIQRKHLAIDQLYFDKHLLCAKDTRFNMYALKDL